MFKKVFKYNINNNIYIYKMSSLKKMSTIKKNNCPKSSQQTPGVINPVLHVKQHTDI